MSPHTIYVLFIIVVAVVFVLLTMPLKPRIALANRFSWISTHPGRYVLIVFLPAAFLLTSAYITIVRFE